MEEAKEPTKEQVYELLREFNAIVRNQSLDTAGWAVPWGILTAVGSDLGVLQTPQLIKDIRNADEFNALDKFNVLNDKDKISQMFEKWKKNIARKIKEMPVFRATNVTNFYSKFLEMANSIGDDPAQQLEWLKSLRVEANKEEYDVQGVAVPKEAPSITHVISLMLRSILNGVVGFWQKGENILAQVPEGIGELRKQYEILSPDLTEDQLHQLYKSSREIVRSKMQEYGLTRTHNVDLVYFLLNDGFDQFEKNPSQYLEKLRHSKDLLLSIKDDKSKANDIYKLLSDLKLACETTQSTGLPFWKTVPDGVRNLRQHLSSLKVDMSPDELFIIFTRCHTELSFRTNVPSETRGDPAAKLYDKYFNELNTALISAQPRPE